MERPESRVREARRRELTSDDGYQVLADAEEV